MRPRGFRADRGQSHAKLELEAVRLRQRLAEEVLGEPLPTAKTLPCARLFERLDRLSVEGRSGPYSVDVGVTELVPGVEARTIFRPDVRQLAIELAPATYAALERDDPRARFSFAHELGHAVLHTDLLVRLGQLPHDVVTALKRCTKPTHPHYFDTEWQADALAAALLMPADALARLQQAARLWSEELEDKFQVSSTAAGIRIENFMKYRGDLLAAHGFDGWR